MSRPRKGKIIKCKTCKKNVYITQSQIRKNIVHCSFKCRKKSKEYNKDRNNKRNPNFKGGKFIGKDGYVLVSIPKNHPLAYKRRYIPEHRLKIEKYLGRYLSDKEAVHHKNGIKSDNRITNLDLVKSGIHYGKVCCPYCNKKFLIR